MVHKEILRLCDRRSAFLDLDFLFMFRVIDSESGDKDNDYVGTLFQSDGKTRSACMMTFA